MNLGEGGVLPVSCQATTPRRLEKEPVLVDWDCAGNVGEFSVVIPAREALGQLYFVEHVLSGEVQDSGESPNEVRREGLLKNACRGPLLQAG